MQDSSSSSQGPVTTGIQEQIPAYSDYYRQHTAERNDPLLNAEVTFQAFAIERANVAALARMNLDRHTARVLDVGCGSGPGILQLMRYGFQPGNMAGVDIDAARVAEARELVPQGDFRCESAERLSFASDTFDIVMESTMFVLMPSDETAGAIAREMVRVAKRGCYLMIVDWRYGKPRNPVYRAVSKKRISSLFEVGRSTELFAQTRGALVPPLGRFLSKRAPALYFAVAAAMPFAVGQVTTVLRKL